MCSLDLCDVMVVVVVVVVVVLIPIGKKNGALFLVYDTTSKSSMLRNFIPK